ncbi:hypothetical protein BAOM_3066 [Peribacillus asahii]|uniref:Uncharacterized protein n=1 Tax=Peribacillus asahii TaxID=228899 RepID=A0A3T0KTV0_9BACI|nr:hypothetical protein [Peribacillus asahii]AZV43675.1 hypothetical protein BAOM_3066 [Peribacillus asahii]
MFKKLFKKKATPSIESIITKQMELSALFDQQQVKVLNEVKVLTK